ncbi:beta-galactosidase GalA [Sphingomonas arantia]|uniref:Beta-galactosidase GalA n=1 Tax=Sphingomonas arantia TaxID=1460676 RepID=A0ABW4TXR6_9SPHN
MTGLRSGSALDRRTLLRTGVAASVVAPVAGALGYTTEAPALAGALPMPAPRDTLPPRAHVEDPHRLLLDRGWRFHLGDIAMPEIRGHGWSYNAAKAGQAQGAAAMQYDDSDWPEIDLPHDWAAAMPFEETANVSQGYRRRGFGWYRRALRLDPADRGGYLELQFGGIATNATIWFNGSVVAHNWSGYTSVYIDITDLARYGDDLNSIVVRVDAQSMEGWWYEGAGLYRHVWLVRRDATHIATDGIHADPLRAPDGSWTVPVTVTLGNVGKAAAATIVEATLLDPDGRTVGTARVPATADPLKTTLATLSIAVPAPRLWSVEMPTLYSVRTRLVRDGRVADERTLRIGFRTLRFDAATGFHLNDRPVKIKGTCNHQDHAGVGVAVPDALWDWRLRRLKALGCNAIRFAHAAIATEVLDACDRLGFLVMSENRNFNTSPDYMKQLEWLVRRDRNRPSVFMWSVFNEEPMQGTPAGYEMVRRMSAVVKALDDSRPVTAAMNGGMFAPVNVSQAVDVVGFNYQRDQYDRFHAANPTLPLTSSEDTSAFMTRGAWTTDRAAQVMSSYDEEPADWGSTHRDGWKSIAERPFVAGAFVWTGFDYHGEPSPFEWPSASSYFGIMDLCGFPKMAFYLHRAQWIDDVPLLDLMPHWNWPGREGQPVRVMALTNVESVRLTLNGRPVGQRTVDRYTMPVWSVPYAPGRLEAIGYRGGREVARSVVETTGAPVALRVTPDRRTMAADGEDVQPFTIDAVDARGRHVPTSNLDVTFAVNGGRIIGLGNGDPVSHEPEQGNRRRLFNGLAQVIVRADGGDARALTLRADATGLRAARSTVRLLATPPRPFVPVTPATQMIPDWRQSPLSAAKPSPDIVLADNDMNSWLFVRAGEIQPAQGTGTWSVLRARFTPHRPVQARGGRIRFRGVVGRGEVWVDGRRLATKTGFASETITVPLPAGQGERVVTLLLESDGRAPSGLGGIVFVEQ